MTYSKAEEAEYIYDWKVTYSTGKTNFIKSKKKQTPRGVAIRMGNQNGWGLPVRFEVVPKEALKHEHEKALKETVEERRKELVELSRPVIITSDTPESKLEELENNMVEAVMEVINPDETDYELVEFVAEMQGTISTLARRVDKFFEFITDAGDNPDIYDAEFLEYYMKGCYKTVDNIRELLDKIMTNLRKEA